MTDAAWVATRKQASVKDHGTGQIAGSVLFFCRRFRRLRARREVDGREFEREGAGSLGLTPLDRLQPLAPINQR